jgi:DNA-binding transcriptional MerR regulator
MSVSGWSIGAVAKQAGVRPSALRYYERVGLIAPQPRASGRRRYEPGVFNRLSLIAYAKAVGFTIAEMKVLLSGAGVARASDRWHALAERKARELDEMIERANRMRRLLEIARSCRCLDLDDCGRRLRSRAAGAALPARRAAIPMRGARGRSPRA